MRKLIHVLTDRNIGGAGRWLLSELRYTDRSRYCVKVLLPEGSLLQRKVDELGFETLCVPGMAEVSWDPASLSAMAELFRRERPEIVHTGASLTARIAAKSAHVPLIVTTKHCAARRGGAVSRLARFLIDGMLSDAVIAVSETVGRQLLASGTPKKRVHVICNGITPVLPASPAQQDRMRSSLGFSKDCLQVVIAARLERVKGVDRFIDAACHIAARRDDVCFSVFGLGSEEKALRAQAEPAGERIHFLGFCSEIEQALALADVVVVSSRSEAFCLSAAEALSMGTPVVAFDVDGVGEVVRNGETGLLAPAEDTDALAQAIETMLDDASLRQRLGQQGREMVLKDYSAEKMVRETQMLYEDLLRKKGRKS